MSKNRMRKALRKQPGYLNRNLKAFDRLSAQTLLTILKPCYYKNLLFIQEVDSNALVDRESLTFKLAKYF